jgi:hypothetical protein
MVSDEKLRKALAARRARMDEDYWRWEPYFEELRDNIQPQAGRFTDDERRTSSVYLKRIVDHKGRKALNTLVSGLSAGMTSPARPWFRLGLYDSDLEQAKPVAEWLYEAQKRMYEVLRGSNIYRTLESCYRQIGCFGTFGGVIVPHFENVIHGFAFPIGTYRIAEDEDGDIGYLHRDCRMTVGSMVAKFGYDKCSSAVRRMFDRGDHHAYVKVKHAIERRHERDRDSPLSRDMPFASMYWEEGEPTFLEIGGFSAPVLLVPRWEQTEGEAWATNSPGMNALGDVVQLQGQHRDKAMAIQKMHNPPLVGANPEAARFTRNVPGGVTVVNTADLAKGGLRPIYEVKPDIQWLAQDINETRQRISEAFFEDLFLMTSQSDRRQITAREIAERHEEKLLVLGPVLESLDHALLSPLIEATFAHMQNARLLPPPPREIQNMQIKVEYISALAQAQKAVGVAPIERTIGFAATLEQIRPGAMDNIDTDETVREFAEQVGVPPKIMRDAAQVAKDRQARAQAQQQQMLMENAQGLAGAANLISEASARGVDGLQASGRI